MIDITNLSKSYNGYSVLKNVNMRLEKGQVIGFIGENGSGKSVLLKMICGFVRPDSGKIIVQGKEIGKDLDGDDKGIVVRDDCLYTEVPLGRIPIAGSNIAAMVVEIDLVLNAAGTITAECSLSGSVGAQILDNQPRPIWDVDISANYGLGRRSKTWAEIRSGCRNFSSGTLRLFRRRRNQD